MGMMVLELMFLGFMKTIDWESLTLWKKKTKLVAYEREKKIPGQGRPVKPKDQGLKRWLSCKSPCRSVRGTGFGSQYPHGRSQLLVTPVTSELDALFWPRWAPACM